MNPAEHRRTQPGLHKGFSLAQGKADLKVGLYDRCGSGEERAYWRRTRVPLIFWLLSVLRKLGISRSINSKYDESAGVLWFAL